ncbi:LysR family transcriptional regulator [Bacillus sp. FJAT-50079]|uniref:LysR family transcriptional regulator n=1 Tax=Bacillus sp. FJAT-50079 TaxID=2833577 RepID=UPI001BC8F02D|nr:LysR family transcriptional regulator [Bacillus sp. FJAT-50079]MBS4208176.1 LysR family transcriptional regulator [Bacillus sp. FJAT-50079]
MDEKDWIILQTIYKEHNITKASEQLYISQPALTYRIKQLEEEFGVNILLRGKKGVEFTAEGEYLVQYAAKMQAELRKTKEHLENLDNQMRGTLRLGVASVFARYELPEILSSFLEKYPDIEIVLKTGWSFEINQMLQKEDAHVGIIRGNYNWQGKKYLLDEEKVCIVSKNKINLDELPSLRRINYKTDRSLKTLIDRWWEKRYDSPPNITMELDRLETCREMVINGLGYAILPSISLKGLHDVHTYEISSDEDFTRKTWLIFRESSLELSIVKAFVEFMEERTLQNKGILV